MRRAMLLSRGDPLGVPAAAAVARRSWSIAALLLLFIVLPNVRKARETAFQE